MLSDDDDDDVVVVVVVVVLVVVVCVHSRGCVCVCAHLWVDVCARGSPIPHVHTGNSAA